MFRHENDFHCANVKRIDPIEKKLHVESEISQRAYPVRYDTLVLACGARPLTFGLPGVEENAFFLKEVHHARRIRNRILENFEMATQPGVSADEKRQLLHFVWSSVAVRQASSFAPSSTTFCSKISCTFTRRPPSICA
ncbi:hypothetical protein PINS_up018240 [Pythium insidiosum]|nr:hypothetical protein PINS_up018240 [Pythium insidiosum]